MSHGLAGAAARCWRRWSRSLPVALAAVVAVAAADQEPPGARQACTASVIMLCPLEAMTGDYGGAKRCLLRKLRRAAPQCQSALASPLPDRRAHPVSSPS